MNSERTKSLVNSLSFPIFDFWAFPEIFKYILGDFNDPYVGKKLGHEVI